MRSRQSGCSRQCGQDARTTAGQRPALRPTVSTPLLFLVFTSLLFPLISCSNKSDANTLVMIIESSPTNLDPRVGIDAQSERIDNLIFDDLLSRGNDLNVAPGLAERWDIPDPLTFVFHLHAGAKFHDGRSLTSRDVKWTFDSLLQGQIRSTKAAVYKYVDHIDAPDEQTVTFHMKEPDATLLWNLSDGAMGIVPYGSGDEITLHPIGSGPFKFVSAETDREVVLERNDNYWAGPAKLARVRFAVVPDETTEALELRKGTTSRSVSALTNLKGPKTDGMQRDLITTFVGHNAHRSVGKIPEQRGVRFLHVERDPSVRRAHQCGRHTCIPLLLVLRIWP